MNNKVAVKSGYYFELFDKEAIPSTLKKMKQKVKINNIKYDLYQGTSLEDERKIDTMFGDRMGYPIKDYIVEKPKCKLVGENGNIYNLIGIASRALKSNGQEDEAKEIALAIELFTNGSLNTFAMNTNVNTSNSLICYDILELGKQLQPIGMLVVLDSILNRITANRTKGKNTYIFIDEIYLLFQYEYSANFLFTLWKRVRKYGAFCTGITQNVDDLLQSHTARTMLANSEFIIMLNQASTDRIELAKLLNISDLQMSFITNVGAGEGLIKVGSSLVPFVNKFPKNTELYRLMTTKPGES